MVNVAAVAATVSIANAYTIDKDTNSRHAINIINNPDCHFELAENEAIKQARSFKLNVEIKDYYSLSANATLEYGSYYYSAGVSARQADSPTLALTYNGSNANACTWGDNISTVFKKGSETLNADNITFTEGGNNEYEYSAYTAAPLTDTMNGNSSVTLYSPVAKTTVRLTDRVGLTIPDKPFVVDDTALTTASLEGRTAEDILSAENAMTGVPNVTEEMRLGIDCLPDCRIAEIVDRDAAGAAVRTVYVPVTYTAVQDFDPDIRAELTVTLTVPPRPSPLSIAPQRARQRTVLTSPYPLRSLFLRRLRLPKVILPDVFEKGDYVAMLCEFSDRSGNMDNDGTINAMEASALLKRIVGLA